MPINLIRSLIDIFNPKYYEQSSSLDKLSKRKIIQTVNECGEKRSIEIEKEYSEMIKEHLDYLYTRCKSLLHFVNKRGVLQTSDDDLELLYVFTAKIKRIHDNITINVDDLYDEFKSIEKRIKRKTDSFRDLSHCNLEHM